MSDSDLMYGSLSTSSDTAQKNSAYDSIRGPRHVVAAARLFVTVTHAVVTNIVTVTNAAVRTL